MGKTDKKTNPNPQTNPETQERNRLKNLAISHNILTRDAPAVVAPLNVSKLVAKHHGRDILKKSQRKNKFLLSFPGLLAPVSGGKIGELKDLGTKNPVLYLDFPQGKMKLFGTIIFPKNRYLTLQFSRGGKNVMCEDNFDTMIVFSEAWWIGNKDENPEEVRLEFPKEMNMGQNTEYDFKGGAGAACGTKQTMKQTGSEDVAQGISKTKLQDDLSDSSNDLVLLENQTMLTPSRHSARTSRKSYKFAEASSGDDSADDIIGTSVGKKDIADPEDSNMKYTSGKTDDLDPSHDVDNADALMHTSKSQIQQSAASVTKSKEVSKSNKSSLVQATLSTLFKKVEEKKVPSKKHDLSSKESGKSLQKTNSKRKSDQVKVQGPNKKKKATEENKSGTKSTARKKKPEDDDDIEEFSSSSKDTIGSDSDWTA